MHENLQGIGNPLSREKLKSFLLKWLFGSRFVPLFPPLRKALKEIVVQQIADFEQQIGVDPFAAEEFVHILPSVIELLGQPCDTAPLPRQFSLNEFPYMWFFVHRFAFAGALRGGQTKWAEPSVCLPDTEGSAKPVKANKQQTAHALGREPFATYSSFTSNLPIIRIRIRA